MGLIALKDWALKNGLSNFNARRLAEDGRIAGAKKIMDRWAVPETSTVPEKLKVGRKPITK